MTDRAPRTRNHLAWLGPLVSVVGLVSYFVVSAKFPFLRDTAWLNLLLVAAGVVLSIQAIRRRRSLPAVGGGVLAVACAALLAGYVFVLSKQLPNTEGVVAVGAEAPAFSLADHTGAKIGLDDFAGQTLVMVFYRGFW
ncbi:MAG: hypothetical protein V2I67_01020 [Thermoanaerobaculales bacterium]|jgi:hypothetical protein|nr:hypothetical protein [Thermoanaerobaculales bacterium]